MKLLKKNQVIIYTIAVLLMVAGYLNYSTNTGEADYLYNSCFINGCWVFKLFYKYR